MVKKILKLQAFPPTHVPSKDEIPFRRSGGLKPELPTDHERCCFGGIDSVIFFGQSSGNSHSRGSTVNSRL